MSNFVEIIGGDGIENAFSALDINYECTYEGNRFNVYKILEVDSRKLDEVPDDKWEGSWGWCRWTDGSNIEDEPTAKLVINDTEILAYYSEYKLEDFIECAREDYEEDGEDISDDEIANEFFENEYVSLADYMEEMWGATSESNVAAIAGSLAKLNGITVGELFTKYDYHF